MTKCGFIAILGAPNAGKSTLVNQLVGGKVSIVCHKVQTTRRRIMGIVNGGDTQYILVDTPGIFKPENTLGRSMVGAAFGASRDSDVTIVLVDACRGNHEPSFHICDQLFSGPVRPTYIAFNKIDLLDKKELLSLAQIFSDRYPKAGILMISALKNKGLTDLLPTVSKHIPDGPWLFPDDQLSDLPMRQYAAEVTREKIFHHLHQELPYQITVEGETWEDRKDGSIKINQVIYVSKEGQKPILLGKGGQKLKTIGRLAREELSDFLGRPVHLFLRIVVKENWASSSAHLMELGLEKID